MATDVTTDGLLRLPRDYSLFHLDPDEQVVADAGRMSLSIPSSSTPCTLTDPVVGTTSTIVDGGELSDFPIEIFDRTDGQRSRWPTFGIRLLPDLPAGLGGLVPGLGLPTLPTVRLSQQVGAPALVGRAQTHLERLGVRDRTMTVDTRGTEITEFRIHASEAPGTLRERPASGVGLPAAVGATSPRRPRLTSLGQRFPVGCWVTGR